MFSYYYAEEVKQWIVYGGSGLTLAMFDTEAQAEDYCNRHNAKMK